MVLIMIFYILIIWQIGGTFVGPPKPETVFPQTMLVDYAKEPIKYIEN